MTRYSDDNVRIHALLSRSRANGPGLRAVIWFQGCSLACPGCFNPGIQDPAGGTAMTVDDLVQWVLSIKDIDGVSLSGGEPTEQMPELNHFVQTMRQQKDLSILLFSGRTRREIEQMPEGRWLLEGIDVLVDGPYDSARANPTGVWPSSVNQGIHLLSKRHKMSDFKHLPDFEVKIAPGGEIITSGLGGFRTLIGV